MPTRHRFALAFVVLAALACVLTACGRPHAISLLAGKQPTEARHVERAHTLTDGSATPEGASWDTVRTAVLGEKGAQVVYDLGAVRQLRAAWLQGDGNDSYTLSVSDDGRTYRPLWTAEPVQSGGNRARWSENLHGSGRYLRLTAAGGDGHYSVSELQVFPEVPASFPPDVPRSYSAHVLVRTDIILFGLALMLFVLLSIRRANPRWIALYSILPLTAGFNLVHVLFHTWPAEPRSVSLVRGTIAAVAALVVAWEVFAPKRLAPNRRVVAGTLVVCALGSILAFYNLGRPQFWNNQLHAWSFVHVLDLRQYYATAKYYPEVGYFNLFDADVAAYSEDSGIPLEKLAQQPMRNLRTGRMSTVGAMRGEIQAAKSKFSPERWTEYRHDERYFRAVMGDQRWLHFMVDLGGNATPVWISVAYVLFNAFPASHSALLGMALLDPLLLLLMFAAVWRVFGWRTMLVCVIVFGTTDFVMYGSNWAGAILRHDWLVYLGLGACALKRKRWLAGGVLFGLATSIRAFPAFAVIGATVPALWWIGERWRAERRLPRLREIYAAQKPTFTIGFAAIGTLLVLVGLTSIFLGPGSWSAWFDKIAQINAESHVNPVGLRTVLVGSTGNAREFLRLRAPLVAAAVLAYVGLLAVACRNKRREQAAMLGLLLLPILMYAANYYEHLICLLPLVVVDRTLLRDGEAPAERPLDATDAWVWMSLLLMCAAEYFTTLVHNDLRLHFYLGSVLLMATIGVMLLAIVRRDAADLLATPAEPP
jgi:hypothetical protein